MNKGSKKEKFLLRHPKDELLRERVSAELPIIDTKRIKVRFNIADEGNIKQIVESCGGKLSRFIAPLRLATITVQGDIDSDSVLSALKNSPEIESAEFSRRHKVDKHRQAVYHNASNDAELDDCWHLKRMNVFHAWKHTKGAAGVKVAVCDSGMVPHIDLLGIQVAGLYFNCTTDTSDNGWLDWTGQTYPPYYSHGTNCQSCVSAKNNNATGVSGVAPDCTPVIVSTGDDEGNYGFEEVAESIVWAVNAGARLISVSWTYHIDVSDPLYTTFGDACAYAWSNNAVVFASAGNGGTDLGTIEVSPAMFPNVLNIGASQEVPDVTWGGDADGRAHWNSALAGSNYGTPIDIVAPGKFIGMASNTEGQEGSPNYYFNGYSWYSGTSFSCPLAAAVGGLVLSINPALTNQEVVDILRASYSQSAAASFTTEFPNVGGILDAAKAVLKAKATVAANAGVIYPYVMFRGVGTTISVTDGVATTTLDGDIIADLRGFSSDEITSVELWAGATKIYDGVPAILPLTASNSGGQVQVKVVAKTAIGSTEETYTDILVSSLGDAIASSVAANPGHNPMVSNPGHNPMVSNQN